MRDKLLRDYTGKNEKTKVVPLIIFCSHPCGRIGKLKNNLCTLLKSSYFQTCISELSLSKLAMNYVICPCLLFEDRVRKRNVLPSNFQPELFLNCGGCMADCCEAAGARSNLSRARTGKHLLSSQIHMYMDIPFFMKQQ